MSKPSSRFIQVLLKSHNTTIFPNTNTNPSIRAYSSSVSSLFSSTGSSNSSIFTSRIGSKSNPEPFFSVPRSFSHLGLSQNPSFGPKSTQIRSFSLLSTHLPSRVFKLNRIPCGFRQFSTKIDGDFARKIFEKPVTSVASAFSRYKEAIGLQVESFLRRNYLVLVGAGGVLVCVLLWRIMFGIANAFVGISEGMAKYGFLALSSAIVTLTVSFL